MEGDRTYKEILSEIFPNRLESHIDEIIEMVEENTPEDEYKLEEMINLLTESGDSTLDGHIDQDYQEEAAGFGHSQPTGVLLSGNGYHFNLLENIFPDISPSFLRKFCEEKCQNKLYEDLDEIVYDLLDEGYVIRASRSDSIFEQLSDMMPDADPDYLRTQAEILSNKSEQDLEQFVSQAIEKPNYPNKRDYFKRQKTMNEVKIYTENFTVEQFLNIFPNPFEHFASTSFQSQLSLDNINQEDVSYAMNRLFNVFPYLREKDIKKVLNKFNKNLIRASDTLARIPRYFKTPRKKELCGDNCDNIELLQELAFIEHKQELKTAMKMRNHFYRLARAEAEKYNLLETCQCCFFDGVLPEECYFCNKNCPFCKECVAKGAEYVIGRGELVFPCLTNCNSEFDIATLRMVLDRKIFDPLITKIQIEEVKQANIEGLETCPFCDFSMILTDDQKIFKCQNVECMEESCRECKHKSHVPLRCNEIEYDEDVKKRTYIENKMTEALVRTCWKCKKAFLKESGCNKMTCTCGAKLCYVCGAENIDYSHFGELCQNKCPLYTQDLKKFHADRVIKSARLAKTELGVDDNPGLLKVDPTDGLEEYFDNL